MSTSSELDTLFQAIKNHLKEKRIKYVELAERLSMSEANVKRIFSSRSCSVEQILKICSVTGITFFEVVSSANKKQSSSFILPMVAEEYFLSNFGAFIFYRNILASGDIESFLKSSPFSNQRSQQYVNQFINLGLLQRVDGRLKRVGDGYLDLSQCPALMEKIKREWVPWFFSQIFDRKGDERYQIKMASTGLSTDHIQHLLKDVDQLIEKYKELGFRDQISVREKHESVGICFGIGPHRIGIFESD